MPIRNPVRVVVAGDRPVVVTGLVTLLDRDSAIEVVGDAKNVTEALKRTREFEAEVLVVTTPLADLAGAALVKRIQGAQPNLKVVGYALERDNKAADEMVKAGAYACLSPTADRRTLVDAVRTALGKSKSTRRRDSAVAVPPSGALSKRELQVLTLIAEGNTNKQIGEILQISVRTVETHRERVMRKLNAQGTAALTKWAISLGLVNPS